MPQVTGNLTVNNGAATPVAVNFAPERIAPELSTFVDRSSGVSALYARMSVKFSPAGGNRPTNRVDFDIDYPVGATVNGVTTVASVGRVRSYAVIPDTWSAADRANLVAFFANALDNASVRGVFKDLDPLY
jgi:hypothetical protein